MATHIRARATVNLYDLRAGQTALVDPRQPYIADLLKSGLLIREEADAGGDDDDDPADE